MGHTQGRYHLKNPIKMYYVMIGNKEYMIWISIPGKHRKGHKTLPSGTDGIAIRDSGKTT